MPLPRLPDRFQPLEELARGETGVLVRARDKLLQREVVLKLPPESTQPVAENERELREARALARVQHRAIVRLLDVLDSPAGPVLVLEPTSGESLAERLAREQRLDADFVRALALELSDALAAVHAIGVVHRGITLDQILLAPDGRPLLGGFGFAKFSGPAVAIPGTTFLYARDSQTPTALPPHPAPEQIAGQAADARSDLFGLGWVLYQCLTGEEPYPIELEVAHWKNPRDPRALVPGTPRDLSEALLRCLAKSPAKRFASAEELKLALARTSAPVAVPAKTSRRKPVLAAAGVLALGVIAYMVWPESRAADGTRSPKGRAVPTEADEHLAGPPYKKLRALVIGIDKYEHMDPLHYAVADADAVRDVLIEKYGFDSKNVIMLRNEQATKVRIQEAIGELRKITDREDGVLVYFAGHGRTDKLASGGDIGYLVPVDGAEDNVHSLSSSIQMDEVETWSKLIPAKHVLFILDACFGGLAATRGPAEANRAYIGFYAHKMARQILTAGGRDELVNESAEYGHSYFTYRLLRALRDEEADTLPKDGVVSATELASYIKAWLYKDTSETGHPQNPQYGAMKLDEEGDFLFLDAAARAALEKK